MDKYTVYCQEMYVHSDGTRELLEWRIADGLTLQEATELTTEKIRFGIIASICLDEEWNASEYYPDGYDRD